MLFELLLWRIQQCEVTFMLDSLAHPIFLADCGLNAVAYGFTLEWQ